MPRDVRLREHVQQKYLWSRVAELTAGVYREILGGTAGR
jgi:hypothetical protein